MHRKLLPKRYGYSAFYVKVTPMLTFRVYKVVHLFSTVGVAHVFCMHISFRHLNRLKRFKWADKKTMNFDCDVDTGIRIIKDLKEKGFTDISHLFKKINFPLYTTEAVITPDSSFYPQPGSQKVPTFVLPKVGSKRYIPASILYS